MVSSPPLLFCFVYFSGKFSLNNCFQRVLRLAHTIIFRLHFIFKDLRNPRWKNREPLTALNTTKNSPLNRRIGNKEIIRKRYDLSCIRNEREDSIIFFMNNSRLAPNLNVVLFLKPSIWKAQYLSKRFIVNTFNSFWFFNNLCEIMRTSRLWIYAPFGVKNILFVKLIDRNKISRDKDFFTPIGQSSASKYL